MTPKKKQILIPIELSGSRIDAAVHRLLPEYSRGKIQLWIKDGHVLVDGKKVESKKKIIGGEILIVDIQEDEELKQFEPENIPIDVIFEDEDLIVLNKAHGMVVHPAAGNWRGTLLNGILNRFPGNESMPRAGIVHRLDKDTSGLMVIAKNEIAQQHLVRQLQNRTVKREYRAIVWGQVWKNGSVNEPIGRHPSVRVKMAVNKIHGKDSVTHYEVLERFGHHTYLRCNLESGRTHQIRVHMDHINTPLVGDQTYGNKKIIPIKELSEELKNAVFNFPRQALHAIGLGLIHPTTNKFTKWNIDLPEDMKKLLEIIRSEPNNSLNSFKDDDKGLNGEIIYIKDNPEDTEFDN